MKTKRIFALLAMMFAICVSAFSEKTPIENLYRYKLSNGLEVFIAEDHDEPTVYINVAVKAGAVAQTAENAGLFHLYEHMMFKSNALYKSAEKMHQVMKNFGVTEDNATTDIDSVEYYFSLPSDKIEDGLAFWNAAIRSPTLDEDELEVEKKVVLSEIEGYAAETDSWYRNYFQMTMFPKAPYKYDAGGSSEAVKKATVEQLRQMQKTYYIPSNAALFISGDVNPSDVILLVKDIFGSWSNEGALPPEKLFAFSKTPLEKTTVAIFPDDSVADNITTVNVYFRGPDTDFELGGAYVEDYLLYLLHNDKYFKKQIEADKSFDLFPDGDVSYYSNWHRLTTTLTFDVDLKKPTENIVDDALRFANKIQKEIMPKVVNTDSFYSDSVKNGIYDDCSEDMQFNYLASRDTIDILRDMWVLDSADFYFDYQKNFWEMATQKNMRLFSKKYIEEAKPLVVIFMSKSNFAELEDVLRSKDVTIIEDDSYLWWKKAEFAPNASKEIITTANGIYVPNGRYSAESKKVSLGDIETAELKNGIKVYFQKHERENQKHVSLQFVLKGGVRHMKKGEEALEMAMFYFMGTHSKKYNKDKREELEDSDGFSLDYDNELIHTSLSMIADDEEAFYKGLKVFADGLINPVFDEKEISDMKENLKQKYVSFISDPNLLIQLEIQHKLTESRNYADTNGFVSDDVEYLTKENLKAHYDRVMNKGDMFIVVTGQIAKEDAIKALDKAFKKAKFADKEGGEYRMEPYVVEKADSIVLSSVNSSGTAFIYNVFNSPDFLSDDFDTAVIASEIYSNALYNIVREKYGACYSSGSFCNGSYIAEWGYKVTDREKYALYAAEARKAMIEDSYIEDYIEGAKITIETSLFKDWQYPSTKSLVIAQGLSFAGDERYWEKRIEKVRAVTADDVRRVFKKYWIDAPSRYFAVTGEGEEDSLKFE